VTLSTEQHSVATQRVHAAGLDRLVDIKLTDYRHVTGQFDRIVSVGMFEHVGVPNYRTYFGAVSRLLTPDGIALIHTIGRTSPPGATNPFITKHIFPGGYVPAMSEVLTAVEQDNLWVTDVECLRLHYARTLRAWLTRFDANLDKVAQLYNARFIRMWRFYLIASEQCFRFDRQAVFQFQLSKSVDAVPITRDYLYAPAEVSRVLAAAQ
jgi:cyclopropane-fatty-acyl-phospholipid synthase